MTAVIVLPADQIAPAEARLRELASQVELLADVQERGLGYAELGKLALQVFRSTPRHDLRELLLQTALASLHLALLTLPPSQARRFPLGDTIHQLGLARLDAARLADDPDLADVAAWTLAQAERHPALAALANAGLLDLARDRHDAEAIADQIAEDVAAGEVVPDAELAARLTRPVPDLPALRAALSPERPGLTADPARAVARRFGWVAGRVAALLAPVRPESLLPARTLGAPPAPGEPAPAAEAPALAVMPDHLVPAPEQYPHVVLRWPATDDGLLLTLTDDHQGACQGWLLGVRLPGRPEPYRATTDAAGTVLLPGAAPDQLLLGELELRPGYLPLTIAAGSGPVLATLTANDRAFELLAHDDDLVLAPIPPADWRTLLLVDGGDEERRYPLLPLADGSDRAVVAGLSRDGAEAFLRGWQRRPRRYRLALLPTAEAGQATAEG